jgi:hypothetical protein
MRKLWILVILCILVIPIVYADTLILQDPDTENEADIYLRCTSTGYAAGFDLFKFNISQIPDNKVIENVSVHFYANTSNNFDQDIAIGWHPNQTWTESNTGNELRALFNSVSNWTDELSTGADLGWNIISHPNITTILEADYLNNSNNYTTIYARNDVSYLGMGCTSYDETDGIVGQTASTSQYVRYIHRETLIDTSLRPYLNITYGDADSTAPEITIDSPTAGTHAQLYMDFNVTGNEDLASCVVSLDNFLTNTSLSSISATEYSWTNSTMTMGTYTASFACEDLVGNENKTEISTFELFIDFPTKPENVSMTASEGVNEFLDQMPIIVIIIIVGFIFGLFATVPEIGSKFGFDGGLDIKTLGIIATVVFVTVLILVIGAIILNSFTGGL